MLQSTSQNQQTVWSGAEWKCSDENLRTNIDNGIMAEEDSAIIRTLITQVSSHVNSVMIHDKKNMNANKNFMTNFHSLVVKTLIDKNKKIQDLKEKNIELRDATDRCNKCKIATRMKYTK